MTTQTQTNEHAFRVGDHVILTKSYGSEPIITTVTRTTKTTFEIEGSDYKFVMPTDYFDRKNGSAVRGSKTGATTVYAYSADRLADLQANHDEEETRKAQKAAAAALDRQRRECIEQAQMDELKKLISFSDFERRQMPDGSRLYQGFVPTDSQYHGFVFAIIRVANNNDVWRDEKVVSGCTYIDQQTGSFSSISSTYHVDDETAVMEAARYLRNS